MSAILHTYTVPSAMLMIDALALPSVFFRVITCVFIYVPAHVLLRELLFAEFWHAKIVRFFVSIVYYFFFINLATGLLHYQWAIRYPWKRWQLFMLTFCMALFSILYTFGDIQ